MYESREDRSMGQFNLVAFQPQASEGALYSFQGEDTAALATAVGGYFAQRGYKLEEGTPFDGTYGKGNTAMRFLFGAFVKRYKFGIKIWSASGQTALQFTKAMSGAMGGAFGYQQMKKEFERVSGDLRLL
jgi:hypothetical protein